MNKKQLFFVPMSETRNVFMIICLKTSDTRSPILWILFCSHSVWQKLEVENGRLTIGRSFLFQIKTRGKRWHYFFGKRHKTSLEKLLWWWLPALPGFWKITPARNHMLITAPGPHDIFSLNCKKIVRVHY